MKFPVKILLGQICLTKKGTAERCRKIRNRCLKCCAELTGGITEIFLSFSDAKFILPYSEIIAR